MPTFTLADLRTRVLDRLDNNDLLYPNVDIDATINECQKITNLVLGYYQGTVVLPGYSQPKRSWYGIPPGIVVPTKVQWESRYLQPIDLNAIGQQRPRWTTETTRNTGYPVSEWVRWGLNLFGIWPADSEGGSQILVTGILEPVPLVNATDTVTWSSDVTNCFDLYCSHVLQLKESEAIFKQATSDFDGYQRVIKRLTWVQGMAMPRWSDTGKQRTGR